MAIFNSYVKLPEGKVQISFMLVKTLSISVIDSIVDHGRGY